MMEVKPMEIPYGYCQCGCGGRTSISSYTKKRDGYIKGEPRRFIHNHHCTGSSCNFWKGGERRFDNGKYKTIRVDGKFGFEHRLIAEKVLGKPLPKGAEVHHYDGYGDESKARLVICESKSYHRIIEARTKAFRACGHANWRKCKICHQYDDPENLYIEPNGHSVRHRSCSAEVYRKRVKEQRELRNKNNPARRTHARLFKNPTTESRRNFSDCRRQRR